MSNRAFVAAAPSVSLSVSAQTAKVRAWVDESQTPESEGKLVLWLQSDADVEFFYRSEEGGSPRPATLEMHAMKARSA